MGVLLPWDRKKAAKQEAARKAGAPAGVGPAFGRRGVVRRVSLAVATAALLCTVYLILTSAPGLTQTIWEVPGGRLLSYRDGLWLVDTGDGVTLFDSVGVSKEIAAPGTGGILALGAGGTLRFTPATASEKVLAVLDDDTILTQRPSQQGEFGEPWLISSYGSSGKLRWTTPVPGAAAAACRRGNRLAIAITDLSAGATPSLCLLSASSGETAWVRALSVGAWRALGAVEDGTWVAVLTSGATAFDSDGDSAWSFNPGHPILAATVIGDSTCIAFRANRRLQTFVYPYEIDALSSDGTVKWSRRVREEPQRLQSWIGKEALAAIAENHVLGLEIEDGARLFAERTGAGPVNLTGDKLLIRDNRGIRLVRVQSIDPSAP